MLMGAGEGGSSNGYSTGSYGSGSRGAAVDVRAAELKERERYLNRLAAAAQVSSLFTLSSMHVHSAPLS